MSGADLAPLVVHDHVAEITLNRPDKMNALDEGLLHALDASVARAEEQPGVRALVLRGAGRVFCAGADLGNAAARADDPVELDAFLDLLNGVFGRIERSRLASVAAVHGLAVAGGFELMLACDVVVLADDARIGDMHAVWGLFPGGGASQRLPRQIGQRRAAWLLMSGEAIAPSDALAAGLVTAVVAAADVEVTARAMAATIARRSPVGTAALKQALRLGSAAADLDEGLAIERDLLRRHMRSRDVRIGIDAFHRRADPEFVGE